MNEAKKFLKNELSRIALLFPMIHIRYGYDATIDMHIVVLSPLEDYYHNKSLDDEWIPVSIKFNELFTSETISFVSIDSPLANFVPEIEWNSYYKWTWANETNSFDWGIEHVNSFFGKTLAHKIRDIYFPDDVLIHKEHDNFYAHYSYSFLKNLVFRHWHSDSLKAMCRYETLTTLKIPKKEIQEEEEENYISAA